MSIIVENIKEQKQKMGHYQQANINKIQLRQKRHQMTNESDYKMEKMENFMMLTPLPCVMLVTPVRVKAFSCSNQSAITIGYNNVNMISSKINWQGSPDGCYKSRKIHKEVPRRDRFGRTIFRYHKNQQKVNKRIQYKKQ